MKLLEQHPYLSTGQWIEQEPRVYGPANEKDADEPRKVYPSPKHDDLTDVWDAWLEMHDVQRFVGASLKRVASRTGWRLSRDNREELEQSALAEAWIAFVDLKRTTSLDDDDACQTAIVSGAWKAWRDALPVEGEVPFGEHVVDAHLFGKLVRVIQRVELRCPQVDE